MIFKFPITDRTESDITKYHALYSKGWQNMTDGEKEEWLKGMKGALNLKDVQRVLNNIEFINRAMGLGLTVSTYDDYFIDTSIFEQIKYLLECEYKTAPNLPYNTIDKWNEIEEILKQCFLLVSENAIKYEGETAYRLAFRVGSQKGVFKV